MKRRGRKQLYDWAAMLRPGTVTLTQGFDFSVSIGSFVNMMRQAARHREVDLIIRVDGAVVTVVIKRRPLYEEAIHDPFAEAVA